jgi:hypothetical protein
VLHETGGSGGLVKTLLQIPGQDFEGGLNERVDHPIEAVFKKVIDKVYDDQRGLQECIVGSLPVAFRQGGFVELSPKGVDGTERSKTFGKGNIMADDFIHELKNSHNHVKVGGGG